MNLSASRAGNAVTLRWTTPSRTTDKLLIKGTITAEICRETMPASAPSPTPAKGKRSSPSQPCAAPVQQLSVVPGASEAVDLLPPTLGAGAPALLAYRVQLNNLSGRAAGTSTAVWAPSGVAPEPIQRLRATQTKAGVVLEWLAARASSGNQRDTIELDRTVLDAPRPVATASRSGVLGGLAGPAKEPAESHLRVEADQGTDPGGTIDRTAVIGRSYRYTAQRVRTVVLNGQTFEVRSLPSAAVTVAVEDVFPPDVPTGLVAVPAFSGNGETRAPAIDLSWEPDAEPHLAGYRIYRRDLDGPAGAWQQLDSALLATLAYRDLSVAAGHRYAYRVTAVSDAGKESAPSDEGEETAPAP